MTTEEQAVPPGNVLRYSFRERLIHWTAAFPISIYFAPDWRSGRPGCSGLLPYSAAGRFRARSTLGRG